MSSLVSVIIPVYNGTNFLSQAIESVLSQSYPHFELIVVDDGSTDQTWSIIEAYGSRLRGYRKENGGVASALNLGIQKAKGDYIAWLSHDDLFLPNKLERQIEFLQSHSQFKACYSDYYDIDENGRLIRGITCPWYPRQIALQTMFSQAYINGSTMLIDRSCFDDIGLFNTCYRYNQDTEMWLRILSKYEIGRTPEKLGKYRIHSGQGSYKKAVDRETETQVMYQSIFETMGISTLLPHLVSLAQEPETVARSYEWFGDQMTKRNFFRFGKEQYRKSVFVWPSWCNRARFKLIVGSWILVYRHYKGIARQLKAIMVKFPLEWLIMKILKHDVNMVATNSELTSAAKEIRE